MEQDKNNRLDELFNQAKNEPAKVSFNEIKEHFVKSNVGAGSASISSKLFQLTNLKIIIMISTLSVIVTGAFLFVNKPSAVNLENKTITKKSEKNLTDSSLIIEEHEKVINEYFEKVATLKPHLLENDTNKRKLKKRKHKVIEKNWYLNEKEDIDDKEIETVESYRFPNLGYEEITSNNKQKHIMLRELARYRRMPAINNIDNRKYPRVYWHKLVKDGKSSSINATGSFHIQKTEVSNLEYRTFLFDLLIQNRKEEFLIAKPDQAMWVKEYPNAFNKPMQENYFSHPAYDDYPAVGMSRKGAELYCNWLTEERNKLNPEKYGTLLNKVRLPTVKEWEQAAKGMKDKTPYPWGGPYLRNSNGCFLANFRPMKDDYTADGAFHTAKVDSYNPNDYGLYCMSGNVAEMVYYEGENMLPGTKGGSWTSVGQELQIIDGKDRFKGQTTPSCNVGFRPVISYLSEDENGGCYVKPITITPPGTKKIANNLFFDQTEITNFMWMEYLFWQKKNFGKESEEFKKSLPDTTIWNVKKDVKSPYMSHYLRHPAYREYPVVGISYEQAVNFCAWRTERVKEMFEIQKQKDKKSIYPKVFEYRLPTKEEWERVAKVGNSLKTIKKLEGAKYSGHKTSNLKRGKGNNAGVAGKLNDNADVTAPVFSYWPNKYGLYNLIGNVAEMTAEKGVAKGGSWKHQEKDVDVEKDFKYSGPTQWLGFRCVLEVKE